MEPIELTKEQNEFLRDLIFESYIEGFEAGTEDTLRVSSPDSNGNSRDPVGELRSFERSNIKSKLDDIIKKL